MSEDLRSPNQKAISQGLKFAWKRKKANGGWKLPAISEATLHRNVAQYLDTVIKAPNIWTSIDAGAGKMGVVAAAQRKARGVKKGWPDVLVFHAAGHAPFYVEVIGIELKAEKGSQSDEQKDVERAFVKVGASYALARSIDDVKAILRKHEVIR
jgi:hypothetical protein